ncbi:AAA family ATPase [Bradyrhizobium japonicum]
MRATVALPYSAGQPLMRIMRIVRASQPGTFRVIASRPARGDPVNFRVGLHSGLVGLRIGGKNAIARFDVAGATVHVAAKLQQEAAADEIRVSAETAKLCRSPLDLTAHKATSGIADRVIEAYTLNARPDDVDHNEIASRYQNPIVNRVDELAALRELLPGPGTKSCSVALLGEPGIGKSRLATAVIAEALTSDVRCCVFYGGVQRRATPFAAARTLVGDMLAANSSSSDAHIREALAKLHVEAGDRRKLEALFVVGKASSRQRLTDNTQTQISRALVNAFLALALDRPTLLLIEDLQWIDPESRHFLKLLARASTPQPLCILLTGRPESSDQSMEIADSLIHLQPLSRANMEALGRQLWPKLDPRPCLREQSIAPTASPSYWRNLAFGGRDERNERTFAASERRVRDSCAAATAFSKDEGIRADAQPAGRGRRDPIGYDGARRGRRRAADCVVRARPICFCPSACG